MAEPFILSWSYAVLLVVVGSIAVGVTAAILRTWFLASRLLVLENAVAILEGTVQREVKVRAGMMRQQQRASTDELVLAELQAKKLPPERKAPWWTKYNKAG